MELPSTQADAGEFLPIVQQRTAGDLPDYGMPRSQETKTNFLSLWHLGNEQFRLLEAAKASKEMCVSPIGARKRPLDAQPVRWMNKTCCGRPNLSDEYPFGTWQVLLQADEATS
jgi:hypothetical protein